MSIQHEDFRFRVRPAQLKGEVKLSGAKNSALRLLAASLLTREDLYLTNYPAGLLDAKIHIQMLEALGKDCAVGSGDVLISERKDLSSILVWHGRSIRNTLLILGALTARTGEGRVPKPGGCNLGDRKYDLHEVVLRKLGAEVWEEDDLLCARAPAGLTGADIYLPIRSTGATENAVICATLAKGMTRVWNPHVRPEILDLVNCLRSMGAEIRVFGQECIEIRGVERLAGTKHKVIADSMEALTWLVASVISGGDIEIHDFPFDQLVIPLEYLRESGACFFRGDDAIIVRGGRCFPLEISTGPYPGINSDMQPLLAAYAGFANGKSTIVDLRFPGRYGYVRELEKMGFHYEIEGNMLRIFGGHPIRGARVTALDLRAGVALVLAGLGAAAGETIIDEAWQIDRGYDHFVEKLKKLGARIDRVFA